MPSTLQIFQYLTLENTMKGRHKHIYVTDAKRGSESWSDTCAHRVGVSPASVMRHDAIHLNCYLLP